MKSIGEVMAMGRTFPESLNKALRSLETGSVGLSEMDDTVEDGAVFWAQLRKRLGEPRPDRLWWIAEGFSSRDGHRRNARSPPMSIPGFSINCN